MARYAWTYTHTDEVLGVQPIVDLDCEIDISTDVSDGELSWSVDGVYVDGKFLAAGDPIAQAAASAIANAAEAELVAGGYLFSKIMDDEGLAYVGLGGNDPDGRFVRRAG